MNKAKQRKLIFYRETCYELWGDFGDRYRLSHVCATDIKKAAAKVCREFFRFQINPNG